MPLPKQKIQTRTLLSDGFDDSVHPVLRRVYGNRGAKPSEIDYSLSNLLPASTLMGMLEASRIIADAIVAKKMIVIVADYDSDGCNGSTVLIRGLKMLGAEKVGYVVPDRFKMGYGISPPLVDLALEQKAELLVCIDNGIVGYAGIDYANKMGVGVVVIDHHAAGPKNPDALAIVNPHQPGCPFKSKAPAAVGVGFLVLNGIKRDLVARSFRGAAEAQLARLLPYVAIGTIGDVVPLDYNNRILVNAGLRMIRTQGLHPGLAALLRVSGVEPSRVNVTDVGFKLVPRLNAAGRMADMRAGINMLLTDDPVEATELANQLDTMNGDRKRVEKLMREDAEVLIEDVDSTGIVIFQEDFHEGVVGLIASRIKELRYRPTMVFARSEAGHLKGSGRSIPGMHLRDAVAEIDAKYPGMLMKWGGHAMALGASIAPESLELFKKAFDDVCKSKLGPKELENILETDGRLDAKDLTLETAKLLEVAGPFGQSFPEPLFEGEFKVLSTKTMGADGQHVRYTIDVNGQKTSLVDFGGSERMVAAGKSVACVYRTSVNRWQDRESLDLQLVSMAE